MDSNRLTPTNRIVLDAPNGSFVTAVVDDGRLDLLSAVCIGEDGCVWLVDDADAPRTDGRWQKLIDKQTGRVFYMPPDTTP